MASSAASLAADHEFVPRVETDANIVRAEIRRNEQPISWQDGVSLWQSSEKFRNVTLEVLQGVPFEAFFWETPPFTGASASKRRFKFVCINGPHLARTQADPSDFGLTESGSIEVFPNLGGDALLVVPTQQAGVKRAVYGHIANFVRGAPREQQHALLAMLGRTLHSATQAGGFFADSRPVWVNTEGSGVPWLHVRLDSRPKYYHDAKFRSENPEHDTMGPAGP